MTKVVITIEDNDSGVDVRFSFDPPLDFNDNRQMTYAESIAHDVAVLISENNYTDLDDE